MAIPQACKEAAIHDIPIETRDDIIAGKDILYIFGEVRYRDAFGQNHQTKFGMMVHRGTYLVWGK